MGAGVWAGRRKAGRLPTAAWERGRGRAEKRTCVLITSRSTQHPKAPVRAGCQGTVQRHGAHSRCCVAHTLPVLIPEGRSAPETKPESKTSRPAPPNELINIPCEMSKGLHFEEKYFRHALDCSEILFEGLILN